MNFLLLRTIEMGPTVVRRLAEQIQPSKLDVAAESGRFSPREVVAHLADWEPIMRARIRQAVENPGSLVEVFDEEQMARDHKYAESDVPGQCILFARERAITAQFLRSLDSDSWKRTATHPERGEQTAEDFANVVLSHDLYHIEQLTASL